MPLSIHKKGDEYCVQEPDGKELGCHPSPAKAQQQIAAIEASKHAQRSQDEGERRAVIPQSEVDYMIMSPDFPNRACRNCLYFHARDDFDKCAIVQDWPEAIDSVGICNEWRTIPEKVTDDLPPEVIPVVVLDEDEIAEMRSRPKLRDLLKRLIPGQKPDGSMWDNPHGFRMLENGQWMGWFSNNFRDFYGTIFAEQGWDDYIYRLEKGVIAMPELRAFHTKGTGHGRATKVFRAGHFVIAVGDFYDNTESEQAYYRAHQHELSMSHGFHFDPEQFIDGVFYAFNTFEVSTLPHEFAGNPYTYFMEVRSMSTVLAPEVRTFLVELMGEEKVTGLEQTAEERGLALEQTGAQYRNFTTRSDEALKTEIDQLNQRLDAMQKAAEETPPPAPVSETETSMTHELADAVRSLTERVETMDAFLKDKFKTRERASQSQQTLIDTARDAQYQTLRRQNDDAQPKTSYVGNLMEAYRGNAAGFEQVDLFGGPPGPPTTPPSPANLEPPAQGQS